MAYLRSLLDAQRFDDAYAQARVLTHDAPQYADGWLVQGTLEYQNRLLLSAEASLLAYVNLKPAPQDASVSGQEMERGLVQAYLLLAQITEQTGRIEQAQRYLERIDSPKEALRVASRQAEILARQGKIQEARALIRAIPELQDEDDRAKLNAEVQLLRDFKQYEPAYDLLREALQRFPDDNDLLYDQAMMAEKLGKSGEMERMLRKLMAAKPDYHHAYNALGYSFADRNVRLDEARQLVTRALELAPNDPFIVDSMAWVEFRSGNTQEALRLLNTAFKARPDAEIAAHLGEVLWSMGQREQAQFVWQQGVELGPDNETLQETTRRLRARP
jgi:tetratricopeptide (TPR) repeat protein